MSTAEVLNRHRKAMRIAQSLKLAGATIELVERFGADEWAIVASAADVNEPTEKTVALVCEMLRDAAKAEGVEAPA